MPLFSVIIPVFNCMDYISKLEKNISIFLNENLEVIVIDDGSNDGSSKILESIHNIKYFKQLNLGVSAARNRGIDLATCEYVVFFDSDDDLDISIFDFFKKNKNKKLVNFFNYSINGAIVNNYNVNNIFNSFELFKLFLDKKINLTICSMIVKRDFLNKKLLRFDEGLSLGEDILFIFYILNSGVDIAYCNNSFFNYCLKDGGAAKSKISYHKSIMIKYFLKFRPSIPQEIRESYDFFLKTLFIYLIRGSVFYGVSDKKTAKFILEYKFILNYRTKFRGFKFDPIFILVSLIYKFIYIYIIFFRIK